MRQKIICQMAERIFQTLEKICQKSEEIQSNSSENLLEGKANAPAEIIENYPEKKLYNRQKTVKILQNQ